MLEKPAADTWSGQHPKAEVDQKEKGLAWSRMTRKRLVAPLLHFQNVDRFGIRANLLAGEFAECLFCIHGESMLSHIAEYLRHASVRCDRLARTCSNEETKRGLESLSLELAEKALELHTDERTVSKGVLLEPKRMRLILSPLEGSLAIVSASTMLLTAIDLWLDAPHLIFAYLVPILLITIWYGVTPALLGLIASVLCAAFIFYPPSSVCIFLTRSS